MAIKEHSTAPKPTRSTQLSGTKAILAKAPRSQMPTQVKPMLATLVNDAFDDPDWAFEVKWDGYRAIAYISKGKAEITSRNVKPFTEKYYPIADALQQLPFSAVLDGEILVIGKDGKANFGALQTWRSEADGDLVFYAFDILWYEGRNLMELPLADRQ